MCCVLGFGVVQSYGGSRNALYRFGFGLWGLGVLRLGCVDLGTRFKV